MYLYKHRFKLILIIFLFGCYPHSVRHRDCIQKEYESEQKEYMKLRSKVDSLKQIIREYERLKDYGPYPRFIEYE